MLRVLRSHDAGPNPACAAGKDEQGSVVVAVMIMMILALVSAATLTRATTSLHESQELGDRATALAGSERGIAEALAVLHTGTSLPFAGEGELVNGKYKYKVTLVDETTVSVVASAQVNTTIRTVEVLAQLYTSDENSTQGSEDDPAKETSGYTLFARKYIHNKSASNEISGLVGSNGSIHTESATTGDRQDVYSPYGRCYGCSNEVQLAGPYAVPDVVIPDVKSQPCSTSHKLSGVVDGHDGIPLICRAVAGAHAEVVLSGVTEIINPPLIIYSELGRSVVIEDSQINVGGDPANFQLYIQAHYSSAWRLYWTNSDLSGTIYAPNVNTAPKGISMTGSLTVRGLLLESGSAPFSIKPGSSTDDPAPTTPVWDVVSWREVKNT